MKTTDQKYRDLWMWALGLAALLGYIGAGIWHESPGGAIVLWIIAIVLGFNASYRF